MQSWPILVTIHNLVNVPLSACENGPRSFVVEAHLALRVSAYSAPVATAAFTTDDVVSTTPNLFEVRLDDVARRMDGGDGGGPKVWRCATPEIEVVVMVREVTHRIRRSSSPYRTDRRADGDLDGTRVVGTSAPLPLNAKDIVEAHKLTTRIVGTEMGQVGLSFTVDPGDKAGYRQRLENFLRTYNPQGLRLVPSVVEVVSELDTFTKLYRRYSIQNYEERLASFFDVYGPQYKSEIPSLLRQWEGREEELMRNLVLDNGPEVTTIDQHQRLTAYMAAYQLDQNSTSVQEILTAHASDEKTSTPAGLFYALVGRYGPEPDPRTYLFPTPRYTPAPPSPPQTRRIPMEDGGDGHSHSSLHHGSSSLVRGSADASAAASAALQRCPPTPAAKHLYVSVPMSPTPIPVREAPLETARSLDRSPSFAVEVDDAPCGGGHKATVTGSHHEAKPIITPKDQVMVLGATTGASRRDVAELRDSSLWRKMCQMMQTRQEHFKPWREHLLFFLDRDEFAAAVRALHVFSEAPDGGEVQVLVEEWSRRVDHAFRTEALTSSDAYYEAVVQEAVRLTGLQSLHLQVMSVSSLFHKEQYAGFAAYVEGQAKRTKTERLVLVGDSKSLMDVARFGLHPAADPRGLYRDALASSATAHDTSTAKGDGPFIFLREPFRHCTEKHSCSLLVCDVAVGEMYSCPTAVHAPRKLTADFLAKYDSCAYVDEANGPVIAVYSRQQILPRLFLQCVVDPQLQPCPAHPGRPVEYYVMESHAFACNRCVVMGAYKGKEVTPIEEAAVMARAGLAEVERTVKALKESMLAYANQLQNEESSMPTAPRRVEAEREINRLQKETEEHVRRIRRRLQLEEEAQLSRINAERTEVQATLEAVERLDGRLSSGMQQRAPVAVVNTLQHIQQERQVEQLMARAHDRVPLAPLELVLPLDGPPATVPPCFSSSSKVHSKGSRVVMGLNESCLPEASADDRREFHTSRAAVSHAPRTPPTSHTTHASLSPSSLYAQYLAVAGSDRKRPAEDSARGSFRIDQPTLDHSTAVLASRSCPVSVTANEDNDGGGGMGYLSAKEALTHGWALLRRGDVAAAHRAWAAVCRAHGTNDVMGTKAHAYIAEAIEKDYAAAAQWYARSLQLDPQDRMTAYNYAVLLEALLDKPQEALRLYNRAAALGDAAASARARELRSKLAASCPWSHQTTFGSPSTLGGGERGSRR
ncbi:conserved hypothetical protein [Leishmania braziliensis MHOM/BR/75/M2904]|uniref:Uncharacterized protein n=2 Tax=Leishmania braziliensis TaxID=5660 RepID=A4H4J8_LEIBR|nr:conserved hypothetical protein [Leishmania braziliensis MHOM/BR/75/M2904]KAI5689979.1 hypothetical protein MNV84_00686 [Leishmania braziliensis]CAJ2466576.1 unnamed protein product [Leishmania braziliensis]CAM36989.1 conserved hypothetical protein [Leishmania braziliensis MHOM/BR/75/M2904]SYZ62858.1 hypothetical_protein [Leishmania braziliensis MHOM/BR/75/M2904]